MVTGVGEVSMTTSLAWLTLWQGVFWAPGWDVWYTVIQVCLSVGNKKQTASIGV